MDFKLIMSGIKSGEIFEKKEEQKFLVTSFPGFNKAMEIGGATVNCIWEIHGPNQGGKTTFGVGILVDAQKDNHFTMLVDAEQRANKEWAKSLGLDLEKCGYIRPNNYEEAAEAIRSAIKNLKAAKKKFPEKMLFILVDSITALVPKRELDGEVGDANFGLQAALTSQFLRIVNAEMKGADVALMFINQERSNVGATGFEKKWKSALGEALQFYASVRLRVNRFQAIKKVVSKGTTKTSVIGRIHECIVEKNTFGPADNKFQFFIGNGNSDMPTGFDKASELLEFGLACGAVEKGDGNNVILKYKNYVFDNKPQFVNFFRDDAEELNDFMNHLNQGILNGEY